MRLEQVVGMWVYDDPVAAGQWLPTLQAKASQSTRNSVVSTTRYVYDPFYNQPCLIIHCPFASRLEPSCK